MSQDKRSLGVFPKMCRWRSRGTADICLLAALAWSGSSGSVSHFFPFFKEDSAIFSYKGKPGSSGSVADSLQRDRPRLHESRQHFPRSKPALAGTSRLGQAAGAGAPARPSPPSLLYREGEQAAPGDDCPAQRTRVSFAGGRGEAEGGAGTPCVVCTMAEKKRRAPPAAGAASSSSLPAEDCPAQLSPAVSPWLPP